MTTSNKFDIIRNIKIAKCLLIVNIIINTYSKILVIFIFYIMTIYTNGKQIVWNKKQ